MDVSGPTGPRMPDAVRLGSRSVENRYCGDVRVIQLEIGINRIEAIQSELLDTGCGADAGDLTDQPVGAGRITPVAVRWMPCESYVVSHAIARVVASLHMPPLGLVDATVSIDLRP
jgi:hypothetical protein